MPSLINKKIIIFIWLSILPLAANAGFLDDLGCIADGSCGLGEVETGFTLLIKYLLGSLAAVSLFYFIYGALNWILSAGKPERVKTGSKIMIESIIGLFIAFGSYLLISFFINEVLNADQPVTPTSYIQQIKII